MNQPIRISAKHLGELAMPNFCARCFWLQLRCGWRMPFTFFPGIFSTLDSHVKRVVAAHFAAHSHLPSWLPPDLGTPLAVPHWSKFGWLDEATDILLVGAPDEMTRCSDGSISILDYKTAKYTENADALLPLYHAQLNGYATITEQLGLGRVSSLWLIYCEPQPLDNSNPLALYRNNGFSMNFAAKIVPVELHAKGILPLLAKVRQIANMSEPPAGRSDCKDCQRLKDLIQLATEATI